MKSTSNQQSIIYLFHVSLFITLIPLSIKLSFWITNSFILSYNETISVPFGVFVLFPIYAITFVPLTAVLLSLIYISLDFLIKKSSFFERLTKYIEPYNNSTKIIFWTFVSLLPYILLLIIYTHTYIYNLNSPADITF